MYEVLVLTFVIGFLTKFVDLIVDNGLKIHNFITYVSAVIYGVLAAYVVVNYPLLAPIGLAVVIGVVVTRKIDSKPHISGIITFVLLLLFWGFSGTDLVLLGIFLLVGIEDEIVSDLADKGKIKGRLARIFEKRIILEVTTFSVSLITGYWIMFLGIFTYDLGYLITKRIGSGLL